MSGERRADSEPCPYFVPVDGGTKRTLFPGVEIHATAGDAMMLSVVRFEADAEVPEHAHPHEQMGILISGTVDFTVGGVTRRLIAGEIWRIPGGVPHRVVAVGGPAVALDCFHPVREDYR